MRICIPTENDNGLQSIVCGHFGSAPYFIIYDTENKNIEVINNRNEHHQHGQCNLLSSFTRTPIDMLVTGGIGMRALEQLNAGGIRAYRTTTEKTVSDVIARQAENSLPEITLDNACLHHHGCS